MSTETTKTSGVKPKRADFDDLPDTAYVRVAYLVGSPKEEEQKAPLPFSAPTLWRKVRDGSFPKPVKLSDRVTAWEVGKVRRWLAERAQA